MIANVCVYGDVDARYSIPPSAKCEITWANSCMAIHKFGMSGDQHELVAESLDVHSVNVIEYEVPEKQLRFVCCRSWLWFRRPRTRKVECTYAGIHVVLTNTVGKVVVNDPPFLRMRSIWVRPARCWRYQQEKTNATNVFTMILGHSKHTFNVRHWITSSWTTVTDVILSFLAVSKIYLDNDPCYQP